MQCEQFIAHSFPLFHFVSCACAVVKKKWTHFLTHRVRWAAPVSRTFEKGSPSGGPEDPHIPTPNPEVVEHQQVEKGHPFFCRLCWSNAERARVNIAAYADANMLLNRTGQGVEWWMSSDRSLNLKWNLRSCFSGIIGVGRAVENIYSIIFIDFHDAAHWEPENPWFGSQWRMLFGGRLLRMPGAQCHSAFQRFVRKRLAVWCQASAVPWQCLMRQVRQPSPEKEIEQYQIAKGPSAHSGTHPETSCYIIPGTKPSKP